MVRKDRSSLSQIKELNRRRKAAKQSDDYAKLAEVYNELGDEYRRLGDLEKAVKKQIKCVFNAETIGSLEYQVYAHRAIAEMYIELADYDLARKHANEHLRAAELYNKAHLIQLAYHVKGWILLQFWTAIVENKSNDSTADAEELLIEAKRSLEKSLAYLNANSSKISADKEARNGGDVNRRRAGAQQVLSEVYDKLGQHTDAITFHLAALKYAERNEDLDLQYRCLFSKLGFSEEDKLRTTQQMLAVAEKMAKAGDKSRKYEALIQFAEAKINVEDFLGAKDAFETVYLEGKACVPKEDWNNARKSLICLYKIAQRVEALHGLAEDDHRLRMRLADKIGDDLCEMNAFDAAVTFYLRVLDAANALRSPKDVLAAATSVASTAFDANQFSLALEYYEKLLALETSAGQSEKKLANTRVCIAKSAVEVDGLSVDRVVEYCSDAALACANAQAVSNEVETLKCLCDYLKRKAPSHPKLSEASSRLAAAEGEMDGGDSDEEEGEEATAVDGFSDDLDLLTPERILQLCKDEFKLRNEDDKIRHEKDKVINSHGETRMHDAARGDDLDYLKKLVKAGYNVNARDYGKWTPLMEAVNANKIDNVRHLLQHNANVNAQSGQGIVDEDKERESASGLTPLMGAAEMLYLPIIRLLIAHPNINLSVKNSDGWTALDMLEDALRRRVADTGIDPDDHAEANRLIAELRRRMLSHGVALAAPPPRSSNRPTGRKAVLSNLRQRNRQAPSVAKVYEDIMVGLGRGQVHRRCGMASPEPPADPSEDRQVAIDEMNDFIVPDADDDVAIVEQPLIEDFVTSLPQSTNKRRLDVVEERQPRKRRSRLRSAYNADHQRAFEPLSSFTNDDNFASIGFESTPIFDTVPVPIASTSASFLPPPRPQSPSKPKVIKLTFENDSGVRIREPICHSVDGQTVADVKKTAEKLLAQKTGKLAIVKLTLMDGTELIDDNFAVDNAFGCDPSANSLNVLRIIVTEWIVQTVVERYEQFALNDKVGAYSNWKSALMLMDSSGVLTLSNSGVTGRKALPLLRALEQDCGLRELDLSGNRLQATEMKLLATIVVSQPSLQRLSLAGCSIVCEALDCFIKHLPPHASIPLKRLELSGNPLGDESGSMMASLLGRCVSLEQIDWCATRITAEFARQIRQSLQGLNHLKIVKFARNPQLGANGISVLLQSCSYLVDADFSNSAKSLDEDLTQALLTYANKPGIRTLRRLNIEGCYLPSKSAERLGSAVNMLTNLSHLNISSTSVDGAGLAMLMDVLRHNTVIAELILLNCPINCKDLPPVAAKLRDQPETFPLRVRMSEPTNNLLVKLLEPLCEQRVLRAL